VHSWTSESPLTQALGLELEGGRPGGAQPGDVVWLAQRKKIPEVSGARRAAQLRKVRGIADVFREGGRSLVDSECRSWTRWSRKVGHHIRLYAVG
jgi:aspartyl-tRNA synthetase